MPRMVHTWQALPIGVRWWAASAYMASLWGLKNTPSWSSRTCRRGSSSSSRQPKTTVKMHRRRRTHHHAAMPVEARRQTNQPKKTRSAPMVKWWLKARAAAVSMELLAPKRVISSNGQHQLPRRLGNASKNVEHSRPLVAAPWPGCAATAPPFWPFSSGCQLVHSSSVSALACLLLAELEPVRYCAKDVSARMRRPAVAPPAAM